MVTYDLNEVNKKGTLYYGGKNDNKNEDASPVASTNDPEVVKKAKDTYAKSGKAPKDQPDYYPYWIDKMGTTDKGETIYKYSNALHHAITSNILAMQNSYEYDDSTLVFVPRVVASSSHHSWLKNEKQSVVTGRAKGNKKSVFYDLDPWYEEKDAGSFKKTSKGVTDGVAGSGKNKAGIYYADLKKYIKNKEKKSSKNKKSFVEVTSNDSKEKYEVCNYAHFSELSMTQTEFQEYLHVWVIDDFSDNEPWMGLYRDDPNVKFIKFQSVEYREYLATAKYLINNVSFPGYFTKRKEQIFVDTWHGIPLKTIGFDIPAGKVSAGNTVRNFLAADYLIAPNHFMAEIYENAFKMKNLYPGKILEIGQPRNDSYFHTDREAIFKKLQMAGVEADPKKKLILYAPTWKGSRYSSPDTSLDAYEKMIRTIEENVDTREYQVLVKPHQIVYYHIKDTVGITGQYIPATVDTNELLRATDVLISDYSSIYFDYLVSKKPILFFIPDLAEYKNYRGLYFGIDKLPGPVAETYEQLGDYVKDAERAMEPYRKVYEREAAWACPQDDGEVCRRLADIVFHGKEDSRCIACQDEAQSPKKKLLMYAGDFSEGDDTEAFLGLAENLDFQKYDVTLLVCGGGRGTGISIFFWIMKIINNLSKIFLCLIFTGNIIKMDAFSRLNINSGVALSHAKGHGIFSTSLF